MSQLADGQVVQAQVYTATALWMGDSRTVNIIAAVRNILLIGANLLWGASPAIE